MFGSTGSKTFHELVHGAEMVTSPREARSGSQGQPPSEQQQQAAAALAGPAPLAAALQQASAAAQQTMQLHGAVAAAVPLALGPAAGVQQVAAAHSAVQGLCAALRQEVGSRQAAAGHLRQLLAEQEGGAAQAAAQLQQASQQLAQLDAKLAQAQASAQAAAGMQQQQPAQQQAAAPWGGAPPAAAQPMQTQEGGEAPAAATSEEAAQLAAALARDRNSAEALLAAFMALPQVGSLAGRGWTSSCLTLSHCAAGSPAALSRPAPAGALLGRAPLHPPPAACRSPAARPCAQDQQEGLGAELAGFLQPEAAVGAAAEMEGGDDLYDPEDL